MYYQFQYHYQQNQQIIMNQDQSELFGAFDSAQKKSKKKSSSFLKKRKAHLTQLPPVVKKPIQKVSHTIQLPQRPQPIPTFAQPQKISIPHGNGCHQYYIAPQNFTRSQPRPNAKKQPAKIYPFELDKFQKVAIDCIERQESVLVAAHTSAGKTAVAQYAIAHALKNNERVVYTSPIKALSNQKFREMSQQFPQQVGLITGDVTVNENASLIIMTTQILRSMLYKGSQITRQMRWVIFDQVHYMRDKQRGVVWEETIILLPSEKVRYVFLSATIPNAEQFARWICQIKKNPCNVVMTDYRPVPLTHYVEVPGGDGIYMVVDSKGKFLQGNFKKAIEKLQDDLSIHINGASRLHKKGKVGDQKEGSEVKKVVELLIKKNLDPAIVFAFSKRQCQANAWTLSKQDFTSSDEKEMIQKIFNNAIQTLADDEQKLPHFQHIIELIKRGIGIHHGGLLPIVKQVIEILFQEGLIKVLFTTETFAMGINMPAKTVVFTSLFKFDGQNTRSVSGSQYIQMSGRAGRRGKDKIGIALLMLDRKIQPDIARSVFKGQSQRLFSAFQLGYNMLLNLMRLEGVDPLQLVKMSFFQFQSSNKLPELYQKKKLVVEQMSEIKLQDEQSMEQRDNILSVKVKYEKQILQIKMRPQNCIPFCSPGRFIRVKTNQYDFGWGIVVNFYKKRIEPKRGYVAKQFRIGKLEPLSGSIGGNQEDIDQYIEEQSQITYIIDALLYTSQRLTPDKKIQPGNVESRQGELIIVPITIDCLQDISLIKIFLPMNLKKQEEMKKLEESYLQILRRFKVKGEEIPLLDPMKDMQIGLEASDAKENQQDKKTRLRFVECIKKQQEMNKKLEEIKISQNDLALYQKKQKLVKELHLIDDQLKQNESIVKQQELKKMIRVLRRLQFCDNDNVVQLKGRVACEISSADQLLVTQLIFNNSFKELDAFTVASLLSCFVSKEIREQKTMPSNDGLKKAYYILQNQAQKIGKVMQDARLFSSSSTEDGKQKSVEDYVKQFKPDLMQITYAWCQGASFVEILKDTQLYEGTIVRCLRRLAELLKQLSSAAKSIGTKHLLQKFDNAHAAMSRGIIFVASLYIS